MDIIFIAKIVQIILAILLTIMILVQSKGQGLTSGLGDSISMYRSRRGIEKTLFIMTIFFASLIIINSILILVLN
jgi:preprotein translocase subunit SecG